MNYHDIVPTTEMTTPTYGNIMKDRMEKIIDRIGKNLRRMRILSQRFSKLTLKRDVNGG